MVSRRRSWRWVIIVIGSLVLLIVLLSILYVRKVVAPSPSRSGKTYLPVELDGRQFIATVADTPASREQGLSGTENLPSNQAMLFIFQTPVAACFWMKDMKYNLDILWFDAADHLIYQQGNLPPASYPNTYCPLAAAKYVLEIPAGTAQQLGVKLGDQIHLQAQD